MEIYTNIKISQIPRGMLKDHTGLGLEANKRINFISLLDSF
jgi:hypothetical protein